jgi:hypothetical protein
MCVFFLADATTLSWPLQFSSVGSGGFVTVGVVTHTPNGKPGGHVTTLHPAPYPLNCLEWVALPGACAPASIGVSCYWDAETSCRRQVGS